MMQRSLCQPVHWCHSAFGFLLALSLFVAGHNNSWAQGALVNGAMNTGSISTNGDSDTWTFSATAGEGIVIRAGEISQVNSFTPRIRLLNPGAVQQGTASGAVAAEIAVTATNTGTFTVIVDDAVGTTASGTYRLTLAKTGDPVVVSPGDEGGPLTNGVQHAGTISTGDLDVWTFTASAGQTFVVRVGEITDTNTFTPWVRLYSPSGVLLGQGFGAVAGEVAATANSNGTYLVVVGDGNGALSGSGAYRLTLAKTGDPVVISAGDEGGPLTNGVQHRGTISTGDLDVWTFTASAGDRFLVRTGQITDTNTFTPWVRVYAPGGASLGTSFGASAAEVTAAATSNGTYLVVVGDGNGSLSGSGDYQLTLAKTGDPVVVSGGDEGGPMTNGVMHTGTIQVGDLDLWTFTANAGQGIVVRVGEITDATTTFTPWVRLYSPNGVLLGQGFGAVAGEATATAGTNGTYLVVVSDGNGGLNGAGAYRLTLAKTGDPVVVSAGDEGGPMTNGVQHSGTILTGDLDLWTFTASAGQAFVVRVGEITDTNTFTPWVRVYAPGGATVGSASGASAAEVSAAASGSGTYLVVVGDGNGALSGSGNYRLTLAKTGDAAAVAAGDSGGAMNGAASYDGNIDVGDLDVLTFTACAGDPINLRMNELAAGSSLTPWIRLYGRDGTLLNSVSGAATATIVRTAPVGGSYTVVLGDGNGALSGSGAYRLTVNSLSGSLKLCDPIVSGTNAAITGVGGITNGGYILYTTTNVATALGLWTPVRTNQFDQFGVFVFTNVFSHTELQRYFILFEQ
jgi:hypothetical protein